MQEASVGAVADETALGSKGTHRWPPQRWASAGLSSLPTEGHATPLGALNAAMGADCVIPPGIA